MKISVYSKIADQITRKGRGQLFFPADSLGFGSNDAIRAAFVASLKLRASLKPKERQFGCAKGLIEMKPDFNEPLEDFREYM